MVLITARDVIGTGGFERRRLRKVLRHLERRMRDDRNGNHETTVECTGCFQSFGSYVQDCELNQTTTYSGESHGLDA